LVTKTIILLELSSRTKFYHFKMMNCLNLQILKVGGFWAIRSFLGRLFLRKTYKQFFGIQRERSNYLKCSISQIGRCFGPL